MKNKILHLCNINMAMPKIKTVQQHLSISKSKSKMFKKIYHNRFLTWNNLIWIFEDSSDIEDIVSYLCWKLNENFLYAFWFSWRLTFCFDILAKLYFLITFLCFSLANWYNSKEYPEIIFHFPQLHDLAG